VLSNRDISLLSFGEASVYFAPLQQRAADLELTVQHYDIEDYVCPDPYSWPQTLAIFCSETDLRPQRLFAEHPDLIIPFLIDCGSGQAALNSLFSRETTPGRFLKWVLSTQEAHLWNSLAEELVRHIAFASGPSFSEEKAIRVKIALQETISNALIHGNLGIGSLVSPPFENDLDLFYKKIDERLLLPEYTNRKIELSAEIDGPKIRLTISDEGFFEKTRSSEGKSIADVGGRGMYLVETSCDRMVIEVEPTRIILEYD